MTNAALAPFPTALPAIPASWSEAYTSLLQRIDDAVAAAHPSEPCRPGACACCRGLFEISLADAALLVAALRKTGVSTEVFQAAQALGTAMESAGLPFPHAGDPESWPAFAPETDVVPCPLLTADGLCRVYAARPGICRFQGYRFTDPHESLNLDDLCPHREGQSPDVPMDLAAFLDEEARLSDALAALLGLPVPFDPNAWETTIPTAILWAAEVSP